MLCALLGKQFSEEDLRGMSIPGPSGARCRASALGSSRSLSQLTAIAFVRSG